MSLIATVVYDLVTGQLADLRSTGTFDLAQCLAPGLSAPAYTDARSPESPEEDAPGNLGGDMRVLGPPAR